MKNKNPQEKMSAGFKSTMALALLLSSFFTIHSFGQTTVGLGNYLTADGTKVPGEKAWVTPDFTQPITSPNWWSTLMTSQFSGNMFSHPLSMRASAKGLEIGYPGVPGYATANGFAALHNANVTVGIEGLTADAARVASYSHFSVTSRWQGAGKTLEATFGHGLPFVYFKVTGGNAVITLGAGATQFANQGNVIGVSIGGKAFGIFAPTGSTWTGTTTLSSSLAGKDYLSIAALPEGTPAALEFYKKYAYSFVKKTVVTWGYVEATANLVSNYSVITEVKEGTEQGTVFALLRHQWMAASTPLTNYTYKSARGEMKVATGTSFSTTMAFNGILPALPNVGADPTQLDKLLSQIPTSAGDGDSYSGGKSFGRLAALIPILEGRGNTAKRTELVKALEKGLESWFTTGGNQQLYFYKGFSTLIGYPASFHSDDRLADHHFHYGYFLMAAATIAAWDPDWVKTSNWGGMVEMLIRDVNSWDDNDPMFARFKYFDAYEGHGWADGIGFENDGNNQESSSESMNFNAALILYGMNTGNKMLRDMGIFMYVNETRAIEQYWWDVDKQVFPAAFTHQSVGMVWSNGGTYATWFSNNPSQIQAINFFPIAAGSLYIGRRPDHILPNYEEGFPGGSWKDIYYEYLAFADPDKAVANYGTGTNPEAGETPAHTYYLLKSLQAVGLLNTQVTASIPSYAVFDKAAVRSYTAYNPSSAPVTVTFNDGFSMDVPAKAQVTKTGPIKGISILPRNKLLKNKNNVEIGFWGGNISKDWNRTKTLTVYDMGGRKILSAQPSQSESKKDIAKGIYLLQSK